MAVGSAQRRGERLPRIAASFRQPEVEAALDLLELADLAWHDCYGPQELCLPPDVLDDVLVLADGDLAALARMARAAVRDHRDVRVAAGEHRARSR
ncbi:hypothetical protein [Polymorphospora lycopeni]|uniref:Uncharacterized protein n=1 Tax=Polymorphospora lycopeni TaxID=3140240 RepID=A0ABV5D1H9_9ACTN